MPTALEMRPELHLLCFKHRDAESHQVQVLNGHRRLPAILGIGIQEQLRGV
jgi:hypothetical protein